MSVIDTLIYDRTQSDVSNDTDKSYISYSDLNRIEEAVKYLSDLMNKYAYENKVNEKTNWNMSEFRKKEDCERIKNNFEVLKNAYPYKFDIPEFKWETIEEANRIEKILFDINEHIENMKKMFIYSGVDNLGEERVWQQKFRRPVEELNYKIFGNVEQAKRSGKNVINIENAGVYNTEIVDRTTNSFTATANTTTSASGVFCYLKKPNGDYIKTEELLNKTLRLKCNMKANNDLIQPRFAIVEGAGGAGTNEHSIQYAGGNTSTFTPTSVDTSRPYIGAYFGIRRSGSNLEVGDSVDFTNIIFTIDNSDMTFELYGISPSPQYPSEVYGLGERSRNVFDNKLIVNENITTKIKNGFRMVRTGDGRMGTVWNISLPAGYYKFVGNYKTNVDTGNDFSFWVKYEDGGYNYISYQSMFSEFGYYLKGKVVSIQAYFQSEVVVGKYFEVTDFMMLKAEQYNKKYISDTGIDIKQIITNNLFDMDLWYLFIKQNDGSYKSRTGVSVTNSKIDLDLPIGEYVVSYYLKSPVGENHRVYVDYQDGSSDSKYITSTGNYEYFKFKTKNKKIKGLHIGYGAGETVIDIKDFMISRIEKDYEPYVGIIKSIDLNNHEPLRKVGDVEDYIDYVNKRIVRKIGKIVLNGSESWSAGPDYDRFILGRSDFADVGDKTGIICDKFIGMSYGSLWNVRKQGFYISLSNGTTGGNHRIIATHNSSELNVTSLQNFKDFLAENPATAYYVLSEPIYEEIELPMIQKISGEYSLNVYDEYLDGRIERE